MTDMKPLWLDRPRPSFPAVANETSYDVAVVGGGITGLLTALLVARSGRSVVLLEARELAAATTGHTTAKVSALQGTKLSRVLKGNMPSVARDYVEANLEGLAWIRRFCEDHDVPHQVRPAFTYATTRVGELRARAELAAAEEVALPVKWDTDPGLPFHNRGAVRLDDQLQLHPMDLVDAVVDQLGSEGGTVHEQSRVRHVHRTKHGVQLATDTAVVEAGTVVLATGLPILDRGGFFARLQVNRSYAAALRSAWVPEGMYLSADSVTRSIRSLPVDGEELLLVGGNGHVTGRGPSERQQIDGLVDWAVRSFSEASVTHTWSAQDSTPAGGLPYVGPLVPGRDDILIATGFDKWGFTNAAASALLLSKIMLGGYPEWGHALRSWTPRELAGTPRALRFNAGVGMEMLNGWLRRPWGADGAQAEGDGEVRYVGRHPVGASKVDGEVHHVSAVCTHLRGIVRWNDAERSWDCPLHGSRFAPDGSVLEGPATCGLRKS